MSKMKRAKIVKFSLDELAGVDAGAQAEAGSVILKRRDERVAPVATLKRSAITSAMVGHTHLITGIDDMQSGCTSSERTYEPGVYTGDSYQSYHSHAWVRADDGSIVLGESAGHTHEVGVTAGTRATKAAPISTPAIEASKVNTMTTKIVILTEAQGAHFKGLSGADADAFVAKSSNERDVEVQKAHDADPIVHTMTDGTEIRKSAGQLAVTLAKRADESAKQALAATEVANVEKAAREATELRKRATDLIGNLAGSDDSHVEVLRAVEAIPDATKRAAAIVTLKAASAAMKAAGVVKGAGGDPEPTNAAPLAHFEAGLAEFAKAKNIAVPMDAVEQYLGTVDGATRKRAYDATMKFGSPGAS